MKGEKAGRSLSILNAFFNHWQEGAFQAFSSRALPKAPPTGEPEQEVTKSNSYEAAACCNYEYYSTYCRRRPHLANLRAGFGNQLPVGAAIGRKSVWVVVLGIKNRYASCWCLLDQSFQSPNQIVHAKNGGASQRAAPTCMSIIRERSFSYRFIRFAALQLIQARTPGRITSRPSASAAATSIFTSH